MKNKRNDIMYSGVNLPLMVSKAPEDQPVFNQFYLKWFLHYVYSRNVIYLQRELKLPKPWTNDKVLQFNRFTNVFREYDRETQNMLNMLKGIREAGNLFLTHLNIQHQAANIVLFRLWNKMETVTKLGGPWKIDQLRTSGLEKTLHPVLGHDPWPKGYFTSAFMTSGLNQGLATLEYYWALGLEAESIPKALRASDFPNYLRPLFVPAWMGQKFGYNWFLDCATPAEFCKTLEAVPGIGSFLSYQIFVDFTYMDWFPWSENEFVVSGPGCHNGLKLLFEDRKGFTDVDLLFWLRDNQEWIFKQHNYHIDAMFSYRPKGERHLNVMALENCFCEFSKYVRLREGAPMKKRPFEGGPQHGFEMDLS